MREVANRAAEDVVPGPVTEAKERVGLVGAGGAHPPAYRLHFRSGRGESSSSAFRTRLIPAKRAAASSPAALVTGRTVDRQARRVCARQRSKIVARECGDLCTTSDVAVLQTRRPRGVHISDSRSRRLHRIHQPRIDGKYHPPRALECEMRSYKVSFPLSPCYLRARHTHKGPPSSFSHSLPAASSPQTAADSARVEGEGSTPNVS